MSELLTRTLATALGVYLAHRLIAADQASAKIHVSSSTNGDYEVTTTQR